MFNLETKDAKHVARKIRAGQISINRGNTGPSAPFGGFKDLWKWKRAWIKRA